MPGGAFVQVARGIYNGVMTFVEKGKQIAQVGTALLGSLSAIAAGQLAPAVQAVETTLVKVLPVALSFLAKWLGLDGISGAIQTGLQKVQAPVEKAVTKVLDVVVDKAKTLWGAVKAGAGKVADKGRQVAAATQPANRRTLAQKQAALDQALTAGTSLLRNHHLTPEAVVRGLLQLRQQHQLTDLRIRQDGTTPQAQRLHLYGAVNPEQEGPTVERPGSSDFNQVEIFPPAPHPLEPAERALLDADTRQWLDKHRPAPGNSLTQASGVSPELARRVMAKAHKAFWEAPDKEARPKTVAGMEFTSGTIIVAPARSRGTGGGDGQLPEGLHEEVKAVLNEVWNNYQQEQHAREQQPSDAPLQHKVGRGHGWCAEPWIISEALKAGLDVRNATAMAMLNRAAANEKYRYPICACASCVRLLQHFQIKDGIFEPANASPYYRSNP